jgi:hypothetical protein
VFFGFGYRQGIAKGMVKALSADESMSDEQNDTALDKRIRLPEPDVKNITVLTENLPNEPVLPWHRFDSPWLERQESNGESLDDVEQSAAPSAAHPGTDDGEQLSLELGQLPLGEQGIGGHQPGTTRNQEGASH